ncbi:DNA cytosine methyltransferase [Clostridium bowmanii]|uniref:DNA cytosine methyltransferase n=1 Tax=Clostridium bowmanii TaxID=132925 RepID=UPI001C0C5DBA|nr:DNA cytosine methyltransferase [Clostridium bowmanii]MBU3191800.1 DNA cytosine methyltransferase [Clostridium bowmanii]MCA1076106.1 DNA cytosine methyltransferase [Clostridium bowmanii]
MKALSLFANIGVAEAYLDDIGIQVVLANEIDKKRSDVYSYIYPNTELICGDITDECTITNIINRAKTYGVDVIIATPPCQGMSTAGKLEENDVRNELVTYAVRVIAEIKPKYVMLENVPMQLLTKINYNGTMTLIPEYLKKELSEEYLFESKVINTCNYGVPQTRERVIFLLTRKDQENIWKIPQEELKVKTLEDAIGHLPRLDPLINDIDYDEHLRIFPGYEKNREIALAYSSWHTPPSHVYRQVISIMHTPTGQTAFNNIKEQYRPLKKNGEPVHGYKNTYKRQRWDVPAYTITTYNRTISSQNNVHPGRFMGMDKNGDEIYSDPRVLTVYEIMLVMSLPENWNIPRTVSENFIRSVIGEGIPPLFIKKIFKQLI